ncbi:MAG: hypothetical protein AB7H97_15520, partial [Pseudobdellovibrionaceae bacterium]
MNIFIRSLPFVGFVAIALIAVGIFVFLNYAPSVTRSPIVEKLSQSLIREWKQQAKTENVTVPNIFSAQYSTYGLADGMIFPIQLQAGAEEFFLTAVFDDNSKIPQMKGLVASERPTFVGRIKLHRLESTATLSLEEIKNHFEKLGVSFQNGELLEWTHTGDLDQFGKKPYKIFQGSPGWIENYRKYEQTYLNKSPDTL